MAIVIMLRLKFNFNNSNEWRNKANKEGISLGNLRCASHASYQTHSNQPTHTSYL